MIGLAVFGAAIGAVLILVLRMGRSASARPLHTTPVTTGPSRFGLGAPASDPSAYAVSAVPVGAVAAAPPAPYAPPLDHTPPPAPYTPPLDYASPPAPAAAPAPMPGAFPPPPMWGQPYGGASLPAPRKTRTPLLLAGAGVLALVGIGLAAPKVLPRFLPQKPLEQPSELGGRPLVADNPVVRSMTDGLRQTVESGDEEAIVGIYSEREDPPLYILVAGRDDSGITIDKMQADVVGGIGSKGLAVGAAQEVRAHGETLRCFPVSGLPEPSSLCLWRTSRTAGLLIAFGEGDPRAAGAVTGEAMEKSGAV